MELKDRIQNILIKNNLNASTFADRLKIQRSNLSHILSGRNKPSIDFIEKFIENFPDEDIIWLITGKTTTNKSIVKTETPTNNLKKNESIERKITRVITFYNDGTFENFESKT